MATVFRVYQNFFFDIDTNTFYEVSQDYHCRKLMVWRKSNPSREIFKRLLENSNQYVELVGFFCDLTEKEYLDPADAARKAIKRSEEKINEILCGFYSDPAGTQYLLYEGEGMTTKRLVIPPAEEQYENLDCSVIEEEIYSQNPDFDAAAYVEKEVATRPGALFFINLIRGNADASSENYNPVLVYLFEKYKKTGLIRFDISKQIIELEELYKHVHVARPSLINRQYDTVDAIESIKSILSDLKGSPFYENNGFLKEYVMYREAVVLYDETTALKPDVAENKKKIVENNKFAIALLDHLGESNAERPFVVRIASYLLFKAWIENLIVVSYFRLASNTNDDAEKLDCYRKAKEHEEKAIKYLDDGENHQMIYQYAQIALDSHDAIIPDIKKRDAELSGQISLKLVKYRKIENDLSGGVLRGQNESQIKKNVEKLLREELELLDDYEYAVFFEEPEVFGKLKKTVLKYLGELESAKYRKHGYTRSFFIRNLGVCKENILRLESGSQYLSRADYEELTGIYRKSIDAFENTFICPLPANYHVIVSAAARRLQSVIYDDKPGKFKNRTADAGDIKAFIGDFKNSVPSKAAEIKNLCAQLELYITEYAKYYRTETSYKQYNAILAEYKLLIAKYIDNVPAESFCKLLNEFRNDALLRYKLADSPAANENLVAHFELFSDIIAG